VSQPSIDVRVRVAASGPAWYYDAVKRALDLVLGLAALALLWPALLGIALAVRLGSPGPVLFRQLRVGKGGRRFMMYKFRSMAVGAKSRGPEGSVSGIYEQIPADDPAVTRLGRRLRRYGLDELPQLLNVIKGDMSLVGPRPTIPEQVEAYGAWERRRLEAHQGITGLAQVTGRNTLTWPERIALDVEYVDSRSIAGDLRLLAVTAWRLFLKRTLPE
jgi:lipopolysaccharide/colanic/teichoic acid biosynthesis glycosyltransferase